MPKCSAIWPPPNNSPAAMTSPEAVAISAGGTDSAQTGPTVKAIKALLKKCTAKRLAKSAAIDAPESDCRHRSASTTQAVDFPRLAVRDPGEVHDRAYPLDDEVVVRAAGVGSGLSESGHRAADQARIESRQRSVIDPELRQPSNLEILDEHIGALRKPAHDLPAVFAGKAGDDRAFAAIEGVEASGIQRFAVPSANERRPPSARVAAVGGFDLDDVGAQVGEHLTDSGSR